MYICYFKPFDFYVCYRVGGNNGMPGKTAGYRPGIPHQPFTKWDTDRDEVEVDYKQIDGGRRYSWFRSDYNMLCSLWGWSGPRYAGRQSNLRVPHFHLRHLKLEIALAIPPLNERKIVANNSTRIILYVSS